MEMPQIDGGHASPSKAYAAFLLDGGHSSFVLCVKSHEEGDLLAPMSEGNLWGSDCVQLGKAGVFFGLGSDAVNQALWIYLDDNGKTEPPERSLAATFSSSGEQIYLEGLMDMSCGDYCDHFFLPEGEYDVQFLSWNLDQARDNFDADPALFIAYAHHELRFTARSHGLA